MAKIIKELKVFRWPVEEGGIKLLHKLRDFIESEEPVPDNPAIYYRLGKYLNTPPLRVWEQMSLMEQERFWVKSNEPLVKIRNRSVLMQDLLNRPDWREYCDHHEFYIEIPGDNFEWEERYNKLVAENERLRELLNEKQCH